MANSISHARLNRRFSEVLQGTSQFADDELEPAAAMVLAKEKKLSRQSMLWKLMAAITAGLIVLLFVKLGNTSDMALRYSNAAQEELGTWVLGIALIGGTTVLLALIVGAGKRKMSASKGALVTALRQRAGEANDNRRTAHESLLRQLGA